MHTETATDSTKKHSTAFTSDDGLDQFFFLQKDKDYFPVQKRFEKVFACLAYALLLPER